MIKLNLEEIKNLRNQGFTFGDIEQKLKTTRSAIAGRISRDNKFKNGYTCIICKGPRANTSEFYCRKCFRECGVQKGIKPTIQYETETCSDNSDWYFANDRTLTRLHGDKEVFQILNRNTRWPDYDTSCSKS